MKFRLSMEFSEDILIKTNIIITTSDRLKTYFSQRSYGEGLVNIVIGVICVAPEFDFFFRPRKKYSKTQRLLAYDIKLNYECLKSSNDDECKRILDYNLIASLEIIKELEIEDFNLEEFRDDLIRVLCQ